jgi:glycosyltransferase involved in cell wall biosynthesis
MYLDECLRLYACLHPEALSAWVLQELRLPPSQRHGSPNKADSAGDMSRMTIRTVILALTPLARDARVLRSAAALCEAGHEVVVIGRHPLPRQVNFHCVGLAALAGAAAQRLELVATQAPANLWPALGNRLYWLPSVRRELLARAAKIRPDIVISNDWLTLPVGRALKDRLGATLVYDSHEYATKEHVQNWKWRLVSQAAVSAIERSNIASADLVLTVSRGIAEALRSDYGLPSTPTIVRNLPSYLAADFRPPNQRRQVLFHGLIRPERGLEELIDSLPRWTFPGCLVIRGYGHESYLESLRERARNQGVADRVRFEPPTAPDELIRQAASADIGYLALPDVTAHYEYALPNKLFEYLMAGLPVLATPRREIRTILDETGAGLVADLDPTALALALNGITEDDIVRMRQSALHAAQHLNWESERQVLVQAVEDAHRHRRSTRAG